MFPVGATTTARLRLKRTDAPVLRARRMVE